MALNVSTKNEVSPEFAISLGNKNDYFVVKK